MDIDNRTATEIMDVIDTLTLKDIEALVLLQPDCAGTDPLKGDWPHLNEDQYATYSKLFRCHFIDALGNVTQLGMECVRISEEETEHEIEQAWAEMEMLKMDELDRKCRQRPNYRPPTPPFNYGEDACAGPRLLLP